MEHLTIELDCTEDRCGKCHKIERASYPEREYPYCKQFGQELTPITEIGKIMDYLRLSECIVACNAQKVLEDSQKTPLDKCADKDKPIYDKEGIRITFENEGKIGIGLNSSDTLYVMPIDRALLLAEFIREAAIDYFGMDRKYV
jgi:hypothetical protein